MESFQQSVSKTSRKLQKRLKKLLSHRLTQPLALFALGLALVTFGAVNYYRARILSFSSVPPNAQEAAQNVDIPIQITIPSINVDLVVDPGQIENGVWQISAKNATFLINSATPGENGNIVIYGHNKKAIFGNLPYLSIGQKIILKTTDGKTYTYEAYQKDFVGPDRVDLVSPTSTEELTLYTCWGLFDTQRAVVKAKLIRSL